MYIVYHIVRIVVSTHFEDPSQYTTRTYDTGRTCTYGRVYRPLGHTHLL